MRNHMGSPGGSEDSGATAESQTETLRGWFAGRLPQDWFEGPAEVTVDRDEVLTTVSAPVMTRLRQPERRVLDTLVDAGVARSRSDALAWCVRLVGRNQDEWIAGLREALVGVERARAAGPEV